MAHSDQSAHGMRMTRWLLLLCCAVGYCGCSKPAATKQTAPVVAPTAGLAAVTPTASPISQADATASATDDNAANASSTSDDIEPFLNIFEAPQGPPPPEKEPEPEIVEIKPGIPTPPRLRLVGFVTGQQAKALVTIADELQLVKVGDKVQDLEFISIAAPSITMKYYDEEIKMDLFHQRWEHVSSGPMTADDTRTNEHRAEPSAPRMPPVAATNPVPTEPPASFKSGVPAIPGFPSADQPGFPIPRRSENGPNGASSPGIPQLPVLPGLPSAQ